MRDLSPTASRVSVIVPTLQEERQIDALLDHLAALAGVDEVVVVDGGSTDATTGRARRHPIAATVLEVPGGRPAQLNAGAAAAHGEILLFLHADTRLAGGAVGAVVEACMDPAIEGGNFALRFDGDDRFARLLAAVYARQRRLGFYYGDSAIWCRREVFGALGGFRALPIMDDYDFARRLERHGPTVCLAGPATTSDRRWRAIGVPRTVMSWFVIRWLYVAGVPAHRLQRLYRVVR